jgi:glycosyltransferase involved in cell wall biosynthesis
MPHKRSTWGFAPALRRYLDEARPDILMSSVTDTHILGVAVKAKLRTLDAPLILRASRNPYRYLTPERVAKRAFEPVVRWKMAQIYGRADAIIVLANDSAKGMRRLLPRFAGPIETIYNPVLTGALLAQSPRAVPHPVAAYPLIIAIGRLNEQKDFATLLRAFAILRRERPARLVILGKGEQHALLTQLAERLGIGDDFTLPGEIENVFEWIGKADLFATTSLWEGVQGALVEALALGCPVVATDAPSGAREVLYDGRIGALVAASDPLAFARAMQRTLDAPPDPGPLVEAAQRFRTEGKAEAYLALFERLKL